MFSQLTFLWLLLEGVCGIVRYAWRVFGWWTVIVPLAWLLIAMFRAAGEVK